MTQLKLAHPARKTGARANGVNGHGVIRQIRIAFKPGNRLAATVGVVLGGFVPAATFTVAHFEFAGQATLHDGIIAVLITGGLAFSARTVFDWALLALRSPVKAAGFVALAEGAMTCSHIWPLNLAALAVLLGINATATACNLAVSRADCIEK